MNSQIILVKDINIDKQYVNVLNYTESQMLALCRANAVASANNYSFLRPTGTIFVNFTYEQCLQANYIAFQNPDYSNKWFFAWIDDVIYKSNENCELKFTIDAWSTWFEKWTAKKCFINRQHVNDDTIGKNTIPENLDVGDVIQEMEHIDLSYSNKYGYWIVVASNWKIKDGSTGLEVLESDKGSQFDGITVYDNVVFGTQLFFIHITDIASFADLYRFISRTNSDRHIEDIENLFVVPNLAIEPSKLTQHTATLAGGTFTWYTMQYDMTPKKFNTTFAKRTSFSDYTPKNNKCFVYPYNYIFISNNQGSNNIYKYEDFSGDEVVFENQLSISVGCSGRIVPKNYKGMTSNDDEALPLGKYPTCAWSSDAFTNWLTQNAVNLATNVGLVAGGIALAVATGGIATPAVAGVLALSTAGTVANTIGQFNQANLAPNISGGQATGDVIWSVDKNMFVIREMRIKTEYLKIIDDYFTRFGYKINKLEMPNIRGRRNWNYVEIGSSEEIGYGDVPLKFMDIINNACRRGVTIWHNHANVGNYNLDNSII